MEKVIITDEQAHAIETLRDEGYTNRQIIANIVNEVNTQAILKVDTALEVLFNGFITWESEDFDKLVMALYVGYYVQ
ncbi:hypothetical protein ACQKJG_18225 [Priestia megaterium]|uniref:hypothetical protein n=1 Tax=Priestia megaterium TaxID=1404 RepID=UPI003D0454D2